MGLPKFKLKDLYNPLGYVRKSVTSLINDISGASAIEANNAAIKTQIAAQEKANKENREYNFELAKLQNQWNIEQWQREVDYNTPQAQMQRYIQAGLNPNLIYSQVNNSTPSISGSLTSGQPSTPVDYSALGGIQDPSSVIAKGVLSTIMQAISFGQDIDMKKAQKLAIDIANGRAMNQMNFETWLQSVDPFADGGAAGAYAKTIAGRRALSELNSILTDEKFKANSLSIAEFDKLIKESTVQDQIDKIVSEAKISREQASIIVERLAVEMGILRNEQTISNFDALMNDETFVQTMNESGYSWLLPAIRVIKMLK